MAKKTEVGVPERKNNLLNPEVGEHFVTPFVDVYETQDAFVLMIDMPGASKESISVTMDRGSLVVKGAIAPRHKENGTLLVNELRATGYCRVFNLSDGVDRNTVDAQFENGVLTVKVFKSEAMKPKEIRIK